MDRDDRLLELDSIVGHIAVELQGLLANLDDVTNVRGCYQAASAKFNALAEQLKVYYPAL